MIGLIIYITLSISWGVYCYFMQNALYPHNKKWKQQLLGFLINSTFFPISVLAAFYNEAIVKILYVKGEKTEKKKSFLYIVYLYPEGTVRVVRVITFSGLKIIRQTATIENDHFVDGSFDYYNHWKDC